MSAAPCSLYLCLNCVWRAHQLADALQRRALAPAPPSYSVAPHSLLCCRPSADGAHFKDVDHTQKATKVTFDSDDE